MSRRCVVCNGRAVHRHHIVYRQHLRLYGGSLSDERNLLDLCHRCHGDHHSAVRKIPVWMLPAGAFEFMSELGIDWYADRYYGV